MQSTNYFGCFLRMLGDRSLYAHKRSLNVHVCSSVMIERFCSLLNSQRSRECECEYTKSGIKDHFNDYYSKSVHPITELYFGSQIWIKGIESVVSLALTDNKSGQLPAILNIDFPISISL